MSKKTVLIVEDEESILEVLCYNLKKEGFRTIGTTSGEDAIDLTKQNLPDLILLDLMLPGINGLDLCKYIKSDDATKHIPVVMLTAKGEESDIVSGLELGADDYITKPFSPKILIARVRAVLRRDANDDPASENNIVNIHNIEINPGRHAVSVARKPLKLTLSEFRLLHFLSLRPGWVYTRYQIVDAIHGSDYPVTDRAIDVLIVSLRRKLGSAGKLIETVRGIGYKMTEGS